jgi:hypothetical protein
VTGRTKRKRRRRTMEKFRTTKRNKRINKEDANVEENHTQGGRG